MKSNQEAVRIDVPRHLQDFNGYCGPACALMVIDFAGSKKSPPVFAQNEFFREVREHAKQASDRRPIKSPAESLLHLLNEHAGGDHLWEKVYDTKPLPVAEAILQSVTEQKQPCLLMVNRGMHWVVAFGMLKKEDGTPSGLLMRDPAWAGMPKFYGLSIFPDEPTIEHCSSPCSCLEAVKGKKNKRTGKVHERFFTIKELLSHRGLQGSLDWEGKGAIALVPKGSPAALAILPKTLDANASVASIGAAYPTEQAGEAALAAVRESGLTGRPDSPPHWDKALANAQAGEPILVKDPEDSRDDFFLVPLNPQDPNASQGAWAMLDAHTLELREVSLLEDWQAPLLPTPEDTQKASQNSVVLPDGTTAKFSPGDLTPNPKNLIWQSSAATVLPYWPAKEFTAPHPVTGLNTSVYLTQDGQAFGQFGPDFIEAKPSPIEQPSAKKQNNTPNPPKSSTPWKVLATVFGSASLGLGALLAINQRGKAPNEEVPRLQQEVSQTQAQLSEAKAENTRLQELLKKRNSPPPRDDKEIRELEAILTKAAREKEDLLNRIKILEEQRKSTSKGSSRAPSARQKALTPTPQ